MTSFSSSIRPTITKDQHATLDYTWNWTDWLTPLTDTIATHQIIAENGITVNSSNIVGGSKVVAWVSGGTEGLTYQLTCRITTTGGRTDDRSLFIKIGQL